MKLRNVMFLLKQVSTCFLQMVPSVIKSVLNAKIRGFVIISCPADFTALHQCGGAASQDSKVRVEVGEFD